MSFILDIDLDYFGLFKDPIRRLDKILRWADRPVDSIVDSHHKAMRQWSTANKKGIIEKPTFILHIDEHHDMLNETPPVQFGNFIYFAMIKWPDCQVHWLTRKPIDHPRMWLSETAWKSIVGRFSVGSRIKPEWPKPDMTTVATSPDFIGQALCQKLLRRINRK